MENIILVSNVGTRVELEENIVAFHKKRLDFVLMENFLNYVKDTGEFNLLVSILLKYGGITMTGQ